MFLKRNVVLRKTLIYLWVITLILLILETLGNFGLISPSLMPLTILNYVLPTPL
jgi:hypothetical protein